MAQTLEEQIRAALVASGFSQYALTKASGVSQSQISEFLAGGDMKLRNAGKLLEAAGATIKVTLKKSPAKKKSSKG